MRRVLRAGVLLALMPLAACTYPVSAVSTVAAPPMLMVRGAPRGALLSVDGVAVGRADAFGPGGHPLALPHGTHRIDISLDGAAIYGSTLYFGDDTARNIDLGMKGP